MSEKTVGIIGGMGPDATVELMRRVIASTPAKDDADHIHMIVDNNPKVPSRIKALIEGTGENPGPCIADMAKRLANAGADFLVIPCNTAHYYYPYASEAVTVPVVNLIDLTVSTILADLDKPRRIGMLASPALRLVGVFDQAFRGHAIEVIYPHSEDRLLGIIKAVKAGRAGASDEAALNTVAEELRTKAVDCLVIACTELSVIAACLRSNLPVFDTLTILSDEVITRAKEDRAEDGAGLAATSMDHPRARSLG